ncbi:MAG TPA: hypothetical protein DD666_05635 [Advenella kashmirensis]|uniref:Uncharacterized protein n=1 Tax=Advenella kashmirensis TaxID=310575 RepID=A0A356LD60_9BURK|nr:hypothetical protein [Advenella kashmirensis]
MTFLTGSSSENNVIHHVRRHKRQSTRFYGLLYSTCCLHAANMGSITIEKKALTISSAGAIGDGTKTAVLAWQASHCQRDAR